MVVYIKNKESLLISVLKRDLYINSKQTTPTYSPDYTQK
jgi:hypothetical protein